LLGALLVKRLTRLAAEHGREWRSIHTAVLSCLLAHRTRDGRCSWPARKVIASYCRVTERTVDRAIVKLVTCGAIEKQQPRAIAGGKFLPMQYSILFEIPSPVDKNGPHRSTKTAVTGRQKPTCNKERREVSSLDEAQSAARGRWFAFSGSVEAQHRGTLTSSSDPDHDDVAIALDRIARAFEASPVTTGKAKTSDRKTARDLLRTYTVDQIEYGILLAGARRVTSLLGVDSSGRERFTAPVQSLAYFSNAIAEAAGDRNMTASYADYLRHTLRKWVRLQKTKGGAA
jgi:hypothetical protein